MNTTVISIPSAVALAQANVQDDAFLVFVDDLSYEFVGGGMAANGL